MKLNKLNIAVAALAAVALAGCKNEDLSRQHYDNKLFISATNFTDEMLIKAANSSYEREITAGIAKPVGQDISIEFAAAPELFDHYRQAFYDEDVKLLSEEFYQFDETKTRIQARKRGERSVTIRFVDVNLLDKNERYVLPVTIPFGVGYRRVAECPQCLLYLQGCRADQRRGRYFREPCLARLEGCLARNQHAYLHARGADQRQCVQEPDLHDHGYRG